MPLVLSMSVQALSKFAIATAAVNVLTAIAAMEQLFLEMLIPHVSVTALLLAVQEFSDPIRQIGADVNVLLTSVRTEDCPIFLIRSAAVSVSRTAVLRTAR